MSDGPFNKIVLITINDKSFPSEIGDTLRSPYIMVGAYDVPLPEGHEELEEALRKHSEEEGSSLPEIEMYNQFTLGMVRGMKKVYDGRTAEQVVDDVLDKYSGIKGPPDNDDHAKKDNQKVARAYFSLNLLDNIMGEFR